MASVFAQGATSALSYTVAVKWKMTVRKSGIQARHLHISTCKRSCLRHAAGKLAYPVKPLNVKSLDRPIRAHKKKGNDWLKLKNPEAPAVRREAEEDWGR
jgi:hypothetical protein